MLLAAGSWGAGDQRFCGAAGMMGQCLTVAGRARLGPGWTCGCWQVGLQAGWSGWRAGWLCGVEDRVGLAWWLGWWASIGTLVGTFIQPKGQVCVHGVKNKLWTTWDRKVGEQLIGELAKTQGSEKNAILQGGEIQHNPVYAVCA